MLSFLQPADAPVIETLESHEVVFAKDQADVYNPLRCLVGHTECRPVLSRWTLTAADREAITSGADVYLELLTFGGPLQPIRVAIGRDVDPDYIREQYALPGATSSVS